MAYNRNPRPASRGKKPAARGYKRPSGSQNRSEALPILLGGLALIMFVIAFLIPQDEYHSLYALRQIASGLVGGMAWTLPIAFGCASYIAYRSEGETRKMLLLVAAFEMCLLAAVEAFSVDAIASQMQIKGYFNFLGFAYRAHMGGGMLGAVLAKPLTGLLTKWITLLLCVLFMLLSLIGMRLFSIREIGEKLSEGIHSYRENHPPREREARPAVREKTPSRRREEDLFQVKPDTGVKLPRRTLYEEDIQEEKINTNAPVRFPNLPKGSSARRVTPVKTPENELSIPEVDSAAATSAPIRVPRKFAAKQTAPEKTTAIEKIDLMEAVRAEDPEKRKEAYRKNALSNHATKPKPVLTYKLENETAPARRMDKMPEADNFHTFVPDESEIPAPRAVTPAPVSVSEEAPRRVPAEPKPSFFEEEPPKKAEKPASPFENPNTVVVKPEAPAPKMQPAKESVPYDFPPIDLMEEGTEEKTDGSYDAADMQRAETLVQTLQSFSIPVKITGISHGPAVTRFELLPAPGIKVSRIASYADDIAMNLAADSVRIEAPIPGKSAVGVEVPNLKKEIVHLRDVIQSPEARKAASRLAVGMGKDNSGKYIVADLASMPHVLIAGQTGSGKSVCINAFIISILFRATPDEVKMIMIDPKMVELNVYNGIPHLLVPVVTDPKKAASALDWAVSEMTRRYKEFAAKGAKNIQSYNRKLEPDEKPMPQIVLIVDELADLMMTAPHDVEEAINRLAQLARAAGIHLVIATQRPSVNVITGVIKANIPTRIAFTVASGVDSRTILDTYGAEKLLGRGDMLYLPSDRNKPLRIQGAWVSEAEVQAVVDYISSSGNAEYDQDILEHMENAVLSDAEKSDKKQEAEEDEVDDLFAIAVKAVVDAGQASISMLQRKLRVGYARAGRLIDEMAARGLVSQSEGSKSREVLITREQYRQLFGDDGDMTEL